MGFMGFGANLFKEVQEEVGLRGEKNAGWSTGLTVDIENLICSGKLLRINTQSIK